MSALQNVSVPLHNAIALVIPVYIDTGVALTILGVEKLSQQCAARDDEADVTQTLDVSFLPQYNSSGGKTPISENDKLAHFKDGTLGG